MKIRVILVICGFLVACSSDLKRGQDYYDNGLYMEAIRSFEKALQDDPNESDAKIGLQKSRLSWISSKLIEVRLTRLAGNTQQSLDQLKAVIDNESLWSVYPEGAVAFTQEEESRFASLTVVDQIEQALKNGKPLLAHSILKNREGLFQGPRAKQREVLATKVRLQGAGDCAKLSQKIRQSDYYFGLFTQKYCRFFGVKAPMLTAQAQAESQKLYRAVEISAVDAQGKPLDESTRAQLLEIFQKDFSGTPWYDAAGKNVLKMTAKLKFQSQHSQEPKKLQHSYTVSVPYDETYTVKKSEYEKAKNDTSFLNGLTQTLNLIGAVGGAFSGEMPYRTERVNSDGTVTVTERKYRKEPRTLEYQAQEHKQKFLVDLLSSGKISDDSFSLAIQDSGEYTSIEHGNNMPEVGLLPQTANLIPDSDWLQARLQLASAQLKEKSIQAWNSRFCAGAKAQGQLSADQFFRCWHSRSSALPKDLENWFVSTFGIKPAEAEILLGV
jgi:hypothetical protein